MNVLTVEALNQMLPNKLKLNNIVCFYQMNNDPPMVFLDIHNGKYTLPATTGEILDCIKSKDPVVAEKFLKVVIHSNMSEYACFVNGSKITSAKYSIIKDHMSKDNECVVYAEVVIYIDSENFKNVTSYITGDEMEMDLLQLKLKLADIGIELKEDDSRVYG